MSPTFRTMRALLFCLLKNSPLGVTDFSIAFNFPRTMALKGQILRTVAQVIVTASEKCITGFQKPHGGFHPGNRITKSFVVEVSNSNFLVPKVFCTDGEIPACPKMSRAKPRTGQFAALLC